jgi:signal transduction histidine kinase/ActR/RegA family two-component response regulator/putative methionine-R-sulfoxide reductase with GAF domain
LAARAADPLRLLEHDMPSLTAWLRSVTAAGGPAAYGYSLAIGAVVLTAIARAALTRWLGPSVDYFAFFLAIGLVGWAAGRTPALCAAALLTVLAWIVWPGSPDGAARATADVWRLVTFAAGGTAAAVIGEHLRDVFDRASVLDGRARRMQEVTSVLSPGTTILDVGPRVLAAARSAIGAASGAVLRVNPRTGELTAVCSEGRTPEADVRWRRIVLDGTFATGEAARTGHPVVIRNLQDWSRQYPASAPQAQASGLASALVLPLVVDGRVLGVLALAGSMVPVRRDEWAFVEAVQTQCALAMARAELYEIAQRSRAAEAAERSRADRLRVYLQHLQDVTAAFSRSGTVSEVAEAFVAAAEALFAGRAGVLYRLLPGWEVLELVASPRYADTVARLNARVPLNAETPSAEAARTRRPVVVQDLDQARRRFPGLAAGLREIDATSCIALPLIFEDRVIGAVGFASKRQLEVGGDDARFLEAIAAQCATALSRAEAYEQTARARAAEGAHRLRMEKLLTHAERLQAATAAFSRSLTASDIAEAVMTTGLRSLGAAMGTIARLGATGDLEIAASVSLSNEAGPHPARNRTDEHTPSAVAVRRRVAVVVRSPHEWEERFPASAGDARSMGLTSCVAVPLIHETSLRGSLTFAWNDEFTPDADEVRFMEALGTQYLAALDRAEAYEAERKAREVAEESGRAREAFLATVSHELRTPLNSILGWADMLRRPALDPSRTRQGLDVIAKSARVQADLIDQLLEMSRMVAGKAQLRMTAATPTLIVESAVDVVRPAAEAKRIALDVRMDSASEAYWCDPQRLQQVLWNLLSNAVKFTPAGGRVSLTQRNTATGIAFTVADTGIGIPKGFLAHVFDAFKQADSSSTREYGGLGLGLAITRQIVELHGGTIHAESDGPGRGAQFIVELPVRRALSPNEPPRRWGGTRSLDPGPLPTLDALRVLVVDDDAGAREMTAAGLVETGAYVTAVESADEALAVLRQTRFDVVVADIGMPGKDGYALVRELRSSGDRDIARIPAVAVTAYTSQRDRTAALEAGFQAHLPKPLDLSALAGTLFLLAHGSALPPGEQQQPM